MVSDLPEFCVQIRAPRSYRSFFLPPKANAKIAFGGLPGGIDPYLTKPFDTDELLAVISGILSHVERAGTEFTRLVSSVKGESAAPSEFNFDEDFTEAEARVVRLVAAGLSNKEIAVELSVSLRRVEGHISNILSKNGWRNRVEIACHIITRNLSE